MTTERSLMTVFTFSFNIDLIGVYTLATENSFWTIYEPMHYLVWIMFAVVILFIAFIYFLIEKEETNFKTTYKKSNDKIDSNKNIFNYGNLITSTHIALN